MHNYESSNLGFYTPKECPNNCELRIVNCELKQIGQVIKSIGRMPWHQEPMKDGISTEMLRGVANRL